jgi:hypothetical protein
MRGNHRMTILRGVAIAVVLQLGALAASAQADTYLYSGSETNVTLNPGTYIITAYGALGGGVVNARFGGFGAEMSAEFNFSTPTTLTLLVGGVGGFADTVYNGFGGGGGGGSFVVQGSTPLVVAGGGGGGAVFDEDVNVRASGGNATITTNGSAGGGDAGGAGGGGGGGGIGGDATLTGLLGPINGQGAGGGGGFYSDGTSGRPVLGFARIEGEGAGGATVASALTTPMATTPSGSGGLSFDDGGAGGLADLGGGFFTGFANGAGGFGGGGGGYSDNNYGFGGGGGGYSGGGGGGASDFTTLPGGGGGGGSFIDSSAIAILSEVSGIRSPDDPVNGEIIITAVPEPAAATLLAIGSLALLRRTRRTRHRLFRQRPNHNLRNR